MNNNNSTHEMTRKRKQQERIFVYINSHATQFIHHPIMKKYITKKLGHNRWIACDDIEFPETLYGASGIVDSNFFHGVSTYQYTLIKKGGTFINPMLYGLVENFEVWNDIIHAEPDFYQDIVYIEIPYEVYEKVAKDDVYFVSKEEYEQAEQLVKKIVHDIQNTYYTSREVIH